MRHTTTNKGLGMAGDDRLATGTRVQITRIDQDGSRDAVTAPVYGDEVGTIVGVLDPSSHGGYLYRVRMADGYVTDELPEHVLPVGSSGSADGGENPSAPAPSDTQDLHGSGLQGLGTVETDTTASGRDESVDIDPDFLPGDCRSCASHGYVVAGTIQPDGTCNACGDDQAPAPMTVHERMAAADAIERRLDEMARSVPQSYPAEIDVRGEHVNVVFADGSTDSYRLDADPASIAPYVPNGTDPWAESTDSYPSDL